MRHRCYKCYRPESLCFCEAIPRIVNRTSVLILQHIGERSHAFNTARIVQQALGNCQLIVGHNQQLGLHQLPIGPKSGLLYPAADAPTLGDLSPTERPEQLIIIDGTWHQAKTIVRDVPQLQKLPCYRLAPASPGQYRIRLEPDAQSLSTLEATVAALRALEPETDGWDQLLAAFNTMVENQLEHLAHHAVARTRKPRQTRHRNLPFTLLQDSQRLVVAYGEATPSRRGNSNFSALPVNWVAQRLGAGDRFSCCLRQDEPLSVTALQHMRLSVDDFDAAVTADNFRERWRQFLRPHDVLIVYHQRTWQLLRQIDAAPECYVVLKSVFGNWQSGIQSMESLLETEGLAIPPRAGQNRADHRLDMAVAMVKHLRAHYAHLPEN